jgi:putative IMPACT (imprinted ancient) family translation regulator
VEKRSVQLSWPYAYYEQIKRLVEAYQGRIDDERFDTEVTLILSLATDELAAFENELADTSSGQVAVTPLE